MTTASPPAAAPRPARRLLWPAALAVVALALAAAAVVLHRPGSPPAGAGAEGTSPGPGEQAGGEGVVCFGIVDLEHGVTALYPTQPGRVARVRVRENQVVPEGAVLLELEDGAARARVAEARAALEAAELAVGQANKLPAQHRGRVAQQQAALESMQHRLAAARLVHERKQEQARKELTTALDVAVAEEEVRSLEALERGEARRLADLKAQDVAAEVRKAEKERDVARARHDQAAAALAEHALKAPRAGTVLRLLAGPGDVLAGPPSQAAVLFAIDGPQVVRAEVEQEFARRVREGMPAVVQDEADESASWRGRVDRVSGWYNQRRAVLAEASQAHDVRTLECLVALEPGQPPLRLGQRVRVLIGPVP